MPQACLCSNRDSTIYRKVIPFWLVAGNGTGGAYVTGFLDPVALPSSRITLKTRDWAVDRPQLL